MKTIERHFAFKTWQSLCTLIAFSFDHIHTMMDIFAVALENFDRIDAKEDAGAKLAPSQDIAGTEGARKNIV